ncbi:hypothetical protein PAXINDRAFT_93553 [Paxillus involutus ATCC 200175]|uniref:Cytochrome P450 n=1 Tax=Paxillus involutus ATCC 200175 TaxID=664439 RepID=A0A0C9STD9_PAXIN|nr:hypothetical protein PAXINDRAFT_93553 [Paxillus involutus ATCC 200175]
MYSSLLFATLCFVFLLVHLKKRGKADAQKLPPGPPPIPILGNIRGIDTRRPWRTYAKWGEKYGGIIYTRLLGQEIIVINSEKVAQDLLDRRSQNYSSRPASLIPINELLGTEFSSIFLPYGDRWRLHRRLFHQAFHLNTAPSFRPIQMQKAHDLIGNLLSAPSNYPTHLHILSISTIMAIVYDYKVTGTNDPIVVHVERAIDIGVNELRPSVAAVIAAFPFCE